MLRAVKIRANDENQTLREAETIGDQLSELLGAGVSGAGQVGGRRHRVDMRGPQILATAVQGVQGGGQVIRHTS